MTGPKVILSFKLDFPLARFFSTYDFSNLAIQLTVAIITPFFIRLGKLSIKNVQQHSSLWSRKTSKGRSFLSEVYKYLPIDHDGLFSLFFFSSEVKPPPPDSVGCWWEMSGNLSHFGPGLFAKVGIFFSKSVTPLNCPCRFLTCELFFLILLS